ncbi:MAG: hypothetical protein Q8R35_01860 [bacterium]|nr:hypothetical protein [bacterium]
MRANFCSYAIIQAAVLISSAGALLAFGGPARAAVYIGIVAMAALVIAHFAFAPGRPVVVAVAAYCTFATGAAVIAIPVVWLAPMVLYRLPGLSFPERMIAAAIFAVFIVAAGVTIGAWAYVAYGRLPWGWHTPLFGGKDTGGRVAYLRDRRQRRGR